MSMDRGITDWLSRAEGGDLSFLEGRSFDAALLHDSLNETTRLLRDYEALDNLGRAVVCLALGDPGVDERVRGLALTPYPTVYRLLVLLQEKGLLCDEGDYIVDMAGLSSQDNPLLQMLQFAKKMRVDEPLNRFLDFIFWPLPDRYTNRLAQYVIGIREDAEVEQALLDSYEEDAFKERELCIVAVRWLLANETDREAIFLTVRYLWQQVCQPRNTYLSNYKASLLAVELRVRCDDLSFNPGYRDRISYSKGDIDKLVAWHPALRKGDLSQLLLLWNRLTRPPYDKQRKVEEAFIQQVECYLSKDGQSGWDIALLWLLGVIH